MDARSIAATAANKGYLTSAADFDVKYTKPRYFFDKTIYENRVFDSKGIADPNTEIQFGPNIKDWPEMCALTDNLVLCSSCKRSPESGKSKRRRKLPIRSSCRIKTGMG